LDSQTFRQTLAQFATGVTVVISGAGASLHGMTVNSFTSVSLVPPLILFCAENRADTFQAILAVQRFTVSILSDQQEELSRRFARLGPQEELFRQTPCQPGIDAIPYLADSLAYLDCAVHDIIPAGDHHIVVGQVNNLARLKSGRPLLYYQSDYYRLISLPPD
jgi:3-hydroxy-9,10-secoandrosta-1,3,5(10)-triene-9,17-dione monooxygenase reductase component